MSKAIRVISVGDTLTRVETLEPGIHSIGKVYFEIRRPCLVDVEWKLTRQHPQYDDGEWGVTLDKPTWKRIGLVPDSLRLKPTRWRRLVAFITRRPMVPRMIVITGRQAK